AATFEDLVVFADTADRVQAVAEARAAGGLDCEPDCHGSGMLRELQREEFRGPRSRYDGQDLFVRRRLGPRYLDDDLPGPDRLARQARARLRDASAIQHVDLVGARRGEGVQPVAHDDAAARAGERSAAVVRDRGAVLQERVEKALAVAQANGKTVHVVSTIPGVARSAGHFLV